MGYLDDAKVRARRRKSPWNLLLIPAVLTPWIILWYESARVLGYLYRLRHRDSEFVLLPDSGGGVAIVIGLLIAWLVPAMLIANVVVWVIPPARRALDEEARGHPGTSFSAANQGLMKFGKFSVSLGLALALAGALL